MLVTAVFLALVTVSSGLLRSTPSRISRVPLSRVYNTLSESSSKPRWAGNDDVLSRFVNMLINFRPLFNMMKPMARSTLIKTAESNGIPWINSVEIAQKYESIFEMNLKDIMKERELSYPGYYTQEFHAYDEGNLNFQAAHECESATLSMALRVWPKDGYRYPCFIPLLLFSNQYLFIHSLALLKHKINCDIHF